MFDSRDRRFGDDAGLATVLRSPEVAAMARNLGCMDRGVSDAERVEQIRALEELKAAAAAAQALVTADFAASQQAAQVAAGTPAGDVGRGVAAQVGLAKRESPARARRYLGWAKVVTTELPRTFAALACGAATEWRAMLVARETACLSAEHRAAVDAEVGDRLAGLGRPAGRGRDPPGRLPARPVRGDRPRPPRRERAAGEPAAGAGHHGEAVRAAARGTGRGGVSPRSARTPTPAARAGTSAAAGRSWPTPWSSGSPDRPRHPPCRSRSTW